MGDWIAFWDSEHSIYVNARHRDVHYRTIAQDIRAQVPPGAAVLDYGCGEALHADLVAASARALILCEAAPTVRAGARRALRRPREDQGLLAGRSRGVAGGIARRRGAAFGRAVSHAAGA